MRNGKHKSWARKYVKVMGRNVLAAFDMGYEDGAAGKQRQAPAFPAAAQPGTPVYGVWVFRKQCMTRGTPLERK